MDVEVPGELPGEIPVGGGLRLRPPGEVDVAAIVAACQDPEIPRWTTVPTPYGPEHARAFVARAASDRTAGVAATFVIADDRDALLGCIGLEPIDREAGEAEAGYWVARAARGRGVARRALAALSRWGLRSGLHRLSLQVVEGNTSSAAVATAVGYRYEGTARSVAARGCGVGDERIDVSTYSLLATDPAAAALLGDGPGEVVGVT